jgi:hypothetical protein
MRKPYTCVVKLRCRGFVIGAVAGSREADLQDRTGSETPKLPVAARGRVRLMTLSTSAVAVCCCRDFPQLIGQTGVLDRYHRLAGEVRHQFDLLLGERTHFPGDRSQFRRPVRRP